MLEYFNDRKQGRLSLLLSIALICFVNLAIFALSEFLWRKKITKNEVARKMPHILLGVWAAFWPWLISYRLIILLSLSGLAMLHVSYRLNIIQSTRQIDRHSYGDSVVAFGVALCALLFQDDYLYCVAILHVALADGFAAIVGKRYGQRKSVKIFGNVKSAIGSLTFLLTSIVLLCGYALKTGSFNTWDIAPVLLIASLATVVEAISIRGLDNITLPLTVAYLTKLLLN